MKVRIGTAGWGIPRGVASAFASEGSVLARYARVLNAVEINTTFARVHRFETFQRWATAVGEDFAFSVKLPRAITHDARLADVADPLRAFLAATDGLGRTLGPLLIQLPPSLAFDAGVFGGFLDEVRAHGDFDLVCEPRHSSWFEPAVDDWLVERRVARVAADPALFGGASAPGGWRGLSYYRLHGSPQVYYSDYSSDALAVLAERLARDEADRLWCIFDNTALGAAAANALAFEAAMGDRQGAMGARPWTS